MAMLTYPSYRRPCGWESPAEAPIRGLRYQGNCSCDAIVVGAGYTGLAIARRLAELCPSDDIRVLDAERIGDGSPGRNSGFMLETVFTASETTKAGKLNGLYRHAHQDMLAHSGLLPFKTDTPEHVFKAAATPRGEKGLHKLVGFLQDTGQPWRYLTHNQLRELTGSDYYRCGISLPGNRLINPVQLINALASRLAQNITVHEDSPVHAVARNKKGWCAYTPEGTLTAPKLLLANNAFAKRLGYGHSRTVTIYTYAGMTPVLDEHERDRVTPRGHWGLLPAHRLGTTFRTTPDGRLLVRGMYGYEREDAPKPAETLLNSLQKRFPSLDGANQLEKWWGGTTSLTSNGAPLWGELKPGLYISAGCNGTGIVKGWLLGTALGNFASGSKYVDIPALMGTPSWIPPEPLRQLGFKVVSGIERQIASDEQ